MSVCESEEGGQEGGRVVRSMMCEKDRERKKTRAGSVYGAEQVCAVLMLVCLGKCGEPVKEKFRTCVRGTGTGGLGKVSKYHDSQTGISMSVCVYINNVWSMWLLSALINCRSSECC